MGKRVHWTTETFIQKLMSLFGDDYIYDFVEYKGVHKKVLLYCKVHGFFKVFAKDLLKGHSCGKCNMPKGALARRDTLDKVINDVNIIHNNKYVIPQQDYKNNKTQITAICPIHGEFKTTANSLKKGKGCTKCGKESAIKKLTMTTENFKKKFLDIYGYEKYELSFADLENKDELGRIKLICHKKDKYGNEHGEFWMTPNNVLSLHGCPRCKQSRLEHQLMKILIDNNIEFVYQCRKTHFSWLENQSLDFYLPKYNIAIECQGGGHYLPIKQFNGEEGFLKRIELDKIKKEKCKNNGVNLIFYTNIKKYIDNIETFNKETIIKKIKTYESKT